MRTATVRLLLAYVSVSTACLFLLTLGTGNAAADGVSGTWTSNVAGQGYFDHTYPANFYYDVNLQLSADGSGTMQSTCTKVDVNVAGWESAKSAVGTSKSYAVSGTVSGSQYTMRVSGYSFPLTVSGGKMYGSGSYTDGSGTVNNWKYDLKGGGMLGLGDASAFSVAGAAVAGVGAAAGLAASVVPPPRPVTGRSVRGFQNPYQPRPPNPQHGPYDRWVPQQTRIYPNAPPQQPYTVAPGDERISEPVAFNPIAPDPALTQSLGGVGVTQGPPDTPPPPNPPNGRETINDPNPRCTACGTRTMPFNTTRGWRWRCPVCGLFPWG